MAEKRRKSVSLDGLEKIGGRSFEDITKELTKSSISYIIHTYPAPGQTTFRYSRIYCTAENFRKAIELLGKSAWNSDQSRSHFYQAEYYIHPSFDLSQLSGKITFHKGMLVESVELRTPHYHLR